jgi:hypothetical protein
VSVPTLTSFLPDKDNGKVTAVIVAPGGGFLSLSMDSEGYQVARWLASCGIAAFVLKCRLQATPPTPEALRDHALGILRSGPQAIDDLLQRGTPAAVEDAAAAQRRCVWCELGRPCGTSIRGGWGCSAFLRAQSLHSV